MPKRGRTIEERVEADLAVTRRAMELILGLPHDYEMKIAVLARAEELVRSNLDPNKVAERLKDEAGCPDGRRRSLSLVKS